MLLLLPRQAGVRHATRRCVGWKSLGSPAIEATANPPRLQGIEVFCPVGDRTPWDKGARQARLHNSICDPGPVAWSWHTDEAEWLTELEGIAREITYIGSSRGPVLVRVFVTNEPLGDKTLVPHDDGRYRIRGLYPGRLDELEAAFQRGERPRPTQTIGYARISDKQLVPIWGPMIPLRRRSGQSLHLAYSVPITEAVRQAITRRLGDGAPSVLTGHTADKAVLRDGHLAIVPLPRIGDRYAEGDVLGVGLLPPRSISDADYSALIQGLGRWLGSGGHVDIGNIRWTMEVAHDDHRRSLQETRLNGNADTWASVTPVVFDRHPRRNLTLSHVVADMCRDVGLPAPVNVETAPVGNWQGSADSRRHAFGKREYLGKNYVAHVRITWPRKVPGPMVLGRGRYFGLGMMLPCGVAA